jgi:putative hemolysin
MEAHTQIGEVLRRGADACRSGTSSPSTPRLVASWARHADDVRAAQRLRYDVFAREMGASLTPPLGTSAGLDADAYDDYCEHLLVRTVEQDDMPSMVVGTYRVLTPQAAALAGGLYTESEFDLAPLAHVRPRIAELGRSCTAPEFRNGGVILLLWSALADFMDRNRLELMIGCASVSMRDGGHMAASLWERLRQTHLAAPEMQVRARLPLPVGMLDSGLDVETPPLIKGYLKCGAKILGAPAWDPDFGVADLPVMLNLQDLPRSYRSRFLKV